MSDKDKDTVLTINILCTDGSTMPVHIMVRGEELATLTEFQGEISSEIDGGTQWGLYHVTKGPYLLYWRTWTKHHAFENADCAISGNLPEAGVRYLGVSTSSLSPEVPETLINIAKGENNGHHNNPSGAVV